MAQSKKPKWDLTEAIAAGEKALVLSAKYSDLLGGRITQAGTDTLRTDVENLKKFPVDGTQKLVEQKAKTAGKDTSLADLNFLVGSIRTLVKKSPTATPEMKKAFGVGARLSGSISHQLAAGKLVKEAYQNFTEWSTREGILAADITAIEALIAEVEAKNAQQTEAVKTKMDATFDKNGLQRQVEDEVSRISALGVIVFGKKDPAVAQLFGDLIPSHSTPKVGGNSTATGETPA
ncbi:MAG: hypothetical protein M0P66_07015 [Salinivirgaceae bacterium]|nr:hypothetical protein [Salinivirgaceae bacterium]